MGLDFIDSHPYASLYLLGCVLVAALTLIKIAICYSINWVTKGNILKKNLEKISAPSELSRLERALVFFGALFLEIALSWVNVFVLLWQIAIELIKFLREMFCHVPDAIKDLRFQLKNNPNLSPEAVWAYSLSLYVKSDQSANVPAVIAKWAGEAEESIQNFNFLYALETLLKIGVVSADEIESAKSIIAVMNQDLDLLLSMQSD